MGEFFGAWTELLEGLAIIVAGVLLIRVSYGWYIFRNSIYKEIYSSYLEYAWKKKRLLRLSKSAWLENALGTHRICYQIITPNGEVSKAQAYVVFLLESGLYVANIKNEQGSIIAVNKGDFRRLLTDRKKKRQPVQQYVRLIKNPMDETDKFAKALLSKISDADLSVYKIVVFPDADTITWSSKERLDCKVLRRKELVEYIKSIHIKNKNIITKNEVDQYYQKIIAEALKQEKNL